MPSSMVTPDSLFQWHSNINVSHIFYQTKRHYNNTYYVNQLKPTIMYSTLFITVSISVLEVSNGKSWSLMGNTPPQVLKAVLNGDSCQPHPIYPCVIMRNRDEQVNPTLAIWLMEGTFSKHWVVETSLKFKRTFLVIDWPPVQSQPAHSSVPTSILLWRAFLGTASWITVPDFKIKNKRLM